MYIAVSYTLPWLLYSHSFINIFHIWYTFWSVKFTTIMKNMSFFLIPKSQKVWKILNKVEPDSFNKFFYFLTQISGGNFEGRLSRNIYISPGSRDGFFRSPIKLRRGEQVHVKTFFTSDYLNKDFEPTRVNRYSLDPTTLVFRPGCAGGYGHGSGCLQQVEAWKQALLLTPRDALDACIRPEELLIYQDLYDECFSK